MEIKSRFDHFNINVTNLERSIAFYEKTLGLKKNKRKEASDGTFMNWVKTKAICAFA